MRSILCIGVIIILLCSMNGCDYNDRNFEGLDDMIEPSAKGPYQLEYTEKIFSATLPAKDILPDWIYSQIYTADTGSLAVVKYKYSEPTQKAVIDQDFERTAIAGEKTEVTGWANHAVKGEKFWCNKVSGGSSVTEFSAYKADSECEGWFISPKFSVSKGMTFTFDLAIKNYKGDCLKVFIASNFNGYMDAAWEDVTDKFNIPSEEAKNITTAGTISLDEWANKDIVVAFQYIGDGVNGKTTTVQLDNIAICMPDMKISEIEEEYVFRGYTEKWVFVRAIPKYALKEDLEREITSKQPTVLPGWLNIAKAGNLRWYDKEYNNVYTEFSAFSSTETCDGWLITPKLNIFEEMIFSFDVCIGYYVADCLTVLISTDFDGQESGIDAATWTDVTSSFDMPKEPTNGYGKMVSAGIMNMTEYLNKDINIAFRYQGSKTEGKTTTYQLDNFFVGKE